MILWCGHLRRRPVQAPSRLISSAFQGIDWPLLGRRDSPAVTVRVWLDAHRAGGTAGLAGVAGTAGIAPGTPGVETAGFAGIAGVAGVALRVVFFLPAAVFL